MIILKTMGNIIFDIKKLTHYYDGHKALDIPSLQFEKGKVYSIIGPNGAGKTTLLNIMAFLLTPSHGSLKFDGKDVDRTDMHRLRLEVTLVHQNPFLYSTSVESNVAYGLRVRKMPKREIKERVEEALIAVGLPGFEKRAAKELSGGEAQRVVLARACVLRPKVLLLDEPSAHVDEENISAVEGVIKELCRLYATTVILTTHNFFQATKLSDQLVTMREGRIVERRMNTEIEVT